jgi:hypothetical protein
VRERLELSAQEAKRSELASRVCQKLSGTSSGRHRSASAPAIAASGVPARSLPVVVAAIAREMAAFLLAIGRDRHGNVIAGHGRLLAAQKLGGTEVRRCAWIT